jgi:hypothetical protein
MYQSLYELEYRREQYRQDVQGLPAEFKEFLINIPYTSPMAISKMLLILADLMIKTGNAIKHSQVKLNKQETY